MGAGVASQRADDPADALEPLELMIAALETAADDAGSRLLLGRADSIRVPKGFWDYSDPGRLIAQRFGADKAATTVAEIGVLQTTLLGGAARKDQCPQRQHQDSRKPSRHDWNSSPLAIPS